jgi:hypothetical protein
MREVGTCAQPGIMVEQHGVLSRIVLGGFADVSQPVLIMPAVQGVCEILQGETEREVVV